MSIIMITPYLRISMVKWDSYVAEEKMLWTLCMLKLCTDREYYLKLRKRYEENE